YTRKFDHFDLKKDNLSVLKEEIKKASKKVKAEFLIALEKAYQNIWFFHQRQFSSIKKIKKGTAGERFVPLSRICIYVPGGRYSYPSTVLMAAIPARVAGVKEIYLTTPAKSLTPELLATADICRISKIYRLGGAQAIAAFAYGTESVPKVDKIVGPGNIYVTLAKKILFGEVGIDLLAGPSEVIILADNSAKVDYLLYDLLAQAEHDPLAKVVLLTREEQLMRKIKKQVPDKFREQIKMLKISSLEEGIKYINQQAPEHLELMVKNAEQIAERIKNAGAIFIGNYSPVAIGDYLAGPSHILPTGGTAKFSSGLSVYDFLKRISIINYNKKKFKEDLPFALTLAKTEGMNYHYYSLKIREKDK
ncbi:MAG TPA: histidinol dehydrogenase, partial [Elusimicrobia bacterium]|nr:histidinol dehydrogenase [Elusimicrobiota bacterium]